MSVPINFRHTNLLFLLHNTLNKHFKIMCKAYCKPFHFSALKTSQMKQGRESDIYDFITKVLLYVCTLFINKGFYDVFSIKIHLLAGVWMYCNVLAWAEKLLVNIFPICSSRGTFLDFPQAERVKWTINVSHFTSSSSPMFYTDYRTLKSVVLLWAPSLC